MLRRVLRFALFLSFSFNAAAQNPWVNAKGSIYAQVSTTFLSYDQIFGSDGDVTESAFETTDNTIGLFGTYSVTNNTEVIFNVPFKAVSSNNLDLSGLGDLQLKVKHQLLRKIPLAIFYGYTAPTSSRDGIVRTGFNQHAIDVGLSGGLSNNNFFGYLSLAYRYRDNIPNQSIIEAEVGANIKLDKKQLYLMFHIDGALNFTDTTDPEADESVLYHNNGQFLAPGLKLSFNAYKNWWINLGTFGAFKAEHQGAAPTFTIGLAYNKKN